MAVSTFIDSKLTRRFHTYDLDGNGVVDKADFELVAQRTADAFGLPEDDPRIAKLRNVLLGIWSRLAEAGDTDGDGQITCEEYKSAFERHMLPDKDAYARAYQPFIDTMMDIADSDGDGRVDEQEYIKWYTALMSIPPEEAAEAFGHLDRDGSGYLSREEMTAAVLDYYFSEDPDAPGNWMTGRPPAV